MFNLQFLLISVIFSSVITGVSTCSISKTYYDNKWNKKVVAEQQAIIDLQNKLTAQEDINNATSESLNAKALAASKERDKIFRLYNDAVSKRSGLQLRQATCEAPAGTPTEASHAVAEPSSKCFLDEGAARELVDVARRGQELSDYAQTAHEYAKAVEAQRQRLQENNNKNE